MRLNSQPSKQTLDWLIRPLTKSGGFRQLIVACGGRHPIEILTALRTLSCGDGTLAPKAAQLAREAELAEPARIAAQGDGLPLPHPLDFEWRFTDAAADELIDRCASVTGPGASIALLGVPSVVLAALRSDHDRVFHVLTEANVVGCALEGFVRADRRFRFGGCARSAGAAIVDPPWYPRLLSDLLALAVAQCREGARVLLSAPPLGLRTGSVGERTQLLGVARSIGRRLG